MKCTSAYPASVDDANLRTIPDMAEQFGTTVGISDHTLGISVSIAAAAMGARIVERHFIMDRSMGGPDANFSLEPDQFKQMVVAVREVEKAMGKISYKLGEKAKKNRIFGRSLFVVEDIKEGDIFSEQNIRSIRPGYGLPPKHYKNIIGKKALTQIKKGTPLQFKHIATDNLESG